MAEAFPRSLTARERAVLVHMLGTDFPGRDALEEQVDAVQAIGGCTCGCATIDLAVDQKRASPAEVESRVPVDAWARSADGKATFGLLLFVDDGYLSCLEIYGTTTEPPSEFPEAERLEAAQRREH